MGVSCLIIMSVMYYHCQLKSGLYYMHLFISALLCYLLCVYLILGVILPRVCGQKKVRDDDSEHNTVSAFELFARCPSLKTYLLQELSKCVKFHHEKKLCSELVPILSLLVKLMPERDEQRLYFICIIF